MATDAFWGPFLNEQGRDSEEEQAFLGYLSTHNLAANAPVEVLTEAYAAFQAWMTESYPQDASATDTSRDVPVQQHPEVIGEYRLPKSRHSDMRLQRPMDAATRPPEQRVAPPAPLDPPADSPVTAAAEASASTGGTSRYSRRSGESSEGSGA